MDSDTLIPCRNLFLLIVKENRFSENIHPIYNCITPMTRGVSNAEENE
jgi:hypothetical protein